MEMNKNGLNVDTPEHIIMFITLNDRFCGTIHKWLKDPKTQY